MESTGLVEEAGSELHDAEDDPDAGPDHEQGDQHPEQEGGLVDREPGKFRAIEEEARAAERTAVIVVLDDIATDGERRVVGCPARRIDVDDGLVVGTRVLSARHGRSVAPVPGSARIGARSRQNAGSLR